MPTSSQNSQYRFGHIVLRTGIAFAFIYPPLNAISDPVSWASYFPSFVTALPISTVVLLHAFGVAEVVLALWILSGVSIRIPAITAAVLLLGIVSVNLSDFAILFRDVSLAALALGLAVLPSPAAH